MSALGVQIAQDNVDSGYGSAGFYTSTAGLMGDVNGDGIVTVTDLLMLLGNLGETASYSPSSTTVGDFTVDMDNFNGSSTYVPNTKNFLTIDTSDADTFVTTGSVPMLVGSTSSGDYVEFTQVAVPGDGDWQMNGNAGPDGISLRFNTDWNYWLATSSAAITSIQLKVVAEVSLLKSNGTNVAGVSAPAEVVLFEGNTDNPNPIWDATLSQWVSVFNNHVPNIASYTSGADMLGEVQSQLGLAAWPPTDLAKLKTRIYVSSSIANVSVQLVGTNDFFNISYGVPS